MDVQATVATAVAATEATAAAAGDFPLHPVCRLPIFRSPPGSPAICLEDDGSEVHGGVFGAVGESSVAAHDSCGGAPAEASGDSAPAESGESAVKPDPKTPGWIRRVCVGANPIERTPCPGRMGALEKSIRGFAEREGDDVVKPEPGTTFDSLTEAYDFYNLYSWKNGFGIRYGKSRLNPDKRKTMQEIVCGCSGKPLRENSRSCRCECPAMIRLLRTSDNGWYITEHRVKHNHVLTPNCGEMLHWPFHKHIDVYTRDLVRNLRKNNINLSKVYNIIGGFFGTVENVPFTKRSLRQEADDDVQKTIEVFDELG
ncbi:hypothetical protein ACQJBY_006548 [Aegilops geniculata]